MNYNKCNRCHDLCYYYDVTYAFLSCRIILYYIRKVSNPYRAAVALWHQRTHTSRLFWVSDPLSRKSSTTCVCHDGRKAMIQVCSQITEQLCCLPLPRGSTMDADTGRIPSMRQSLLIKPWSLVMGVMNCLVYGFVNSCFLFKVWVIRLYSE